MSEKVVAEMSLVEAQEKRKILVKDLLTYRLSLDPSSVESVGGVPVLQRTLRQVDLRIATLKSGK